MKELFEIIAFLVLAVIVTAITEPRSIGHLARDIQAGFNDPVVEKRP